ncbi:head maturation protease, ClpP-related [Roseovarius nubinhibens]|uniref:ATP-dependent Clp protease proteolytic subunit n=1 Tax=Roseovarius nubinhibens TaxID=314263 RepID=A0A348W760_9RHOB|nr:peptidase [Roseovarius nubinhibens]|tara:strand:- start:27864 stop:28706 length:843 start_codon:yes stop_codon:yes gene_type:complete
MTKRNLPKVEIGARPGVRSDISPKALQRWSPDVKAASQEDVASISILDPIGADLWGDGVTAKRIAAALRSIGPKPVTVNVNSPGGDYFEGLAIYNLLREHSEKVTVNILGIAASAASVIAMAGDEVRIARAGFLMIHNTWVVAAGDRHAMREVASWLEPFDETAVDIYAARTGIDEGALAEMLDRETWIGGQSAVDQGFADALLAADAIEIDGDAAASASMRAERKLDLLCARAGLSNSSARDLKRDLKGGKPGAAQNGMPGAAELTQGVEELLAKVKAL